MALVWRQVSHAGVGDDIEEGLCIYSDSPDSAWRSVQTKVRVLWERYHRDLREAAVAGSAAAAADDALIVSPMLQLKAADVARATADVVVIGTPGATPPPDDEDESSLLLFSPEDVVVDGKVEKIIEDVIERPPAVVQIGRNELKLFGFGPMLQKWIEDLPGASNCVNYKYHAKLKQLRPHEGMLAAKAYTLAAGCARCHPHDPEAYMRYKALCGALQGKVRL
jgi:hypothetical protein